MEGLDRLEATASEGFGSGIPHFRSGTDVGRAINEVKAEVNRIITFPEDAERPQVRELTSCQDVIRFLIHGGVPGRTLID